MANSIQEIIKNYIMEEIFQDFPTEKSGHYNALGEWDSFEFFLSADVDCMEDVSMSPLGTEWGYVVCEAYGLDNIRAIRGLMQSKYDDLSELQNKIFDNCTTVLQLSKDKFASDSDFNDICDTTGTDVERRDTSECVETTKYGIGEDYNTVIDDVKEADERVSTELSLTAFDVTKYSKDELYNMVEAKFSKVNLKMEILEMEMIPTKIEEHFVNYDCIPTEYKITFTDGDIVHMKDGEKIPLPLEQCSISQINERLEPLGIRVSIEEEDYVVGYISPLDNEDAFLFKSNKCLAYKTAFDYVVEKAKYLLEHGLNYPISLKHLIVKDGVKSKDCRYDREKTIILPKYILIDEIDLKMKEKKSDVVFYNDKPFICAVFDGEYRLWECEVK